MTSSGESPVAIVTGCASGIGLEAVKLLVSRGWHVMMADWNEQLCSRQSSLLGPQTAYMKCNVASWEDQLAVFEATVALWGHVDLFGANAGVPEQVPMLFETGDKPEKPSTLVIDVDYVGVVYGISLALFYMRKQGGKGGRIIVTASQVGIHPSPWGPIYGGAKAACIHLIRSMAPQLAKEKIYLNALCPGLTDTGITHVAMDQFPREIITPMENHMKAWEQFLATDISNAIMEVDAGGIYNRQAPHYWSPKHQTWLGDPRTMEMWAKGGPLGASRL